jgi:MFS family permease
VTSGALLERPGILPGRHARHRRACRWRPLRERDFFLSLSGQTISRIGNGAYKIGLSWSVYRITGSPAEMGLVLAVNLMPQLALLLIGGTVADRITRRTVVLAADATAAVLTGGLAALSAIGSLSITAIMAGSFLLGVVSSFYEPAYAAMNRDLVTDDQLSKANSLQSLSRNAARLLGPVIGGVTFGYGGVTLLFGLDAASFGLAVLAMLFTAATGPAQPERQSVLRDLASGLRYTVRTRWLLFILTISLIANCLCLAPYADLLPDLVRSRHGDPRTLGLLTAVEIGTTIVGVMVIRRIRCGARAGSALLALASVIGLGTVVLGFSRFGIAALAAGAALIGAGLSFDVIENTVMQAMVPPRLLSRVYSVNIAVSYSLLPAGYAVSGLLARQFGASAVLSVGGIALIASCGCTALVPEARRLRAPEPIS